MKRFLIFLFMLLLNRAAVFSQVDTNSEHFYLFTYFTDENTGACLALSSDGMQWQLYNNAKAVIVPALGSKLMRDPMTCFDPLTQTFHLVWTSGWSETIIGYASSKDLKTWSAQTALSVGAKIPNCGNCWAPEIFHDDIKDSFMVFWSTETDASKGKRPYYSMTKDFKKFTDPVVFFDPGYTVIDECMLKVAEAKYYLFFKDERSSQTGLTAKNIHFVSGATPQGPWSEVSKPITNTGCEGPAAIKIGKDYCVYFDPFTSSGSAYRMVKVASLDTSASPWPSGGTLKAGTSNFTYRHGDIIEIPRAYVMFLLYNRPIPATAAFKGPLMPVPRYQNAPVQLIDLLGRTIAAETSLDRMIKAHQRILPAGFFIETSNGLKMKKRAMLLPGKK